jgi:ribosomal protein S4E
MTIHPTKDILLASDNESGVVAWAVAEDGSLRYAGRHAGELGQLSAIEIAPSGREMITLSNSRGEIAVAILDAATGYPAETKLLARVSSPHSLAVVYS